jgi:hypothetical protein
VDYFEMGKTSAIHFIQNTEGQPAKKLRSNIIPLNKSFITANSENRLRNGMPCFSQGGGIFLFCGDEYNL